MMQREREGLRVTVREYQELEAGEAFPDSETWELICDLFGWPKTFVGPNGDRYVRR